MQPGQVVNGCWVFPFMNVGEYVQHIVFGYFATKEFQNPRIIGSPVRSPELKPWVPQAASRADYGYVDYECTLPFPNASDWHKLKIINRNEPNDRPPQ